MKEVVRLLIDSTIFNNFSNNYQKMKVIIGLFFVAMIGFIEITATDANVASGCVGFKCRFQNSGLDGFDSSMEESYTTPGMTGSLER